ncbi:MAG: isochorismatase family cysteine hydrolase [Pseudomonadota bacterium]
MKACLLVIDMQNDFLSRFNASERQHLFDRTNELVALCRQKRADIIWIYQTFKPDLSDAFLEMRDHNIPNVIEGTPGAEIAAALDVQDHDRRLLKKRYSGFFETPLSTELAQIDPDLLILAGVNTHACIRMTAIDAYQRDFRVVLASDCISSPDKEHAAVTLRYMKDKMARVMANADIANLMG